MCDASGAVREYWRYLLGTWDSLGPEEIAGRARELRRLLQENGVTYNPLGDPEGGGRPWPLDPLPLPVPSREWAVLERGLVQRAELLNLLLADLYGPQEVLRRGLLPAELVFGDPRFLRPCVGIVPRCGRYLEVYAADLVRGIDGRLRAVTDHTQAPGGSGYALENRILLSRVFPSLYRDSQVHRLAIYYRALRQRTAQLSGRGGDPRVVLLTPGPGDAAYFEHAYLAKYLGYALAQGSDLTVRGQGLWLKTLDGLRRVDVLLRRVDGHACDPLELQGASFQGPAGLVQSARSGQVAIANPLGSGLLENPAFLAFLPPLCRHLLGEELALPSVPTWWCGQAGPREYVLAHLPELVIRNVLPGSAPLLLHGAGLSETERTRLVADIQRAPHRYVAQEPPLPSTVPTYQDGVLTPRPLLVRSFAVAGSTGYTVMPGGLARVGDDDSPTWAFSPKSGSLSKDVWVLASEPGRQETLLASESGAVTITREGGEVASRVAENLFWMGRYAARAEAGARLLREALGTFVEGEEEDWDDGLAALLRAVTTVTNTAPGFLGEGAEERLRDPEPELLAVVGDPGRSGGLRFNLRALARNAREVRDRLSADAWRVVNELSGALDHTAEAGHALEELEHVVLYLAAFTGLSVESMSRGQGWRFLDAGWRVERALQTVSLVRSLVAPAPSPEALRLDALLAVTDSVMTYRRRYRTQLEREAVLDLVLQDEGNPRSVAYQLAFLQTQVPLFPETGLPVQRAGHQRALLEAATELRLWDPHADGAGAGPRDPLFGLLEHLEQLLEEFCAALTGLYFTHTEAPRQLTGAP
ncbi:MAG: circularly permuted type 2 ATP-grasp protein [Deferrisomatales bacterium]|nr:circularly permuted type 2 ATP-grasp protein [Deferrisomatales bacterium]